MASTQPIRAAQYLRMSTDHQRYSLAHQTAAIATYALAHGFSIVETFADAGRSGLTLEGRNELKRLLAMVLSGTAPFEALLVLDISRWGRFQDVDESAHYEWLVRKAGIAVHYCGEIFENDGSLTSAIMKSLKRVMAGEYSRELSRKVWTAQVHQARLGFRMGATARFGLRRMLIDASGTPKMLLDRGEHKNIREDRVILVPGPAEEQAIVRRIYRLSTTGGLSDRRIAQRLNADGVPALDGRPWSQYQVKEVLTGEVYTGLVTFNRTSKKLGGKNLPNPETDWVRLENAFPPIISRRVFREAQRARKTRRSYIYSEEQLLGGLRALLAREGRLTLGLIDQAPDMPSATAVRRRFGSLHAAFARVGYHPVHRGPAFGPAWIVDRNRAFCIQVEGLLKAAGAHVRRLGPMGLFEVDKAIRLAVAISRFHGNRARRYWKLSVNPDIAADCYFAGLLSPTSAHTERYYLLPADRIAPGGAVHFSANAPAFESYRVADIVSLRSVLQRLRL